MSYYRPRYIEFMRSHTTRNGTRVTVRHGIFVQMFIWMSMAFWLATKWTALAIWYFYYYMLVYGYKAYKNREQIRTAGANRHDA